MDQEKRDKFKILFEELYKDINGHSLSSKGRDKHGLTDKSFVYGEVKFDSFYEFMTKTNPQPGQVFYDLGSGTGKAVFLAHFLFPFRKACGIELVETLAQAADEVKQKYDQFFRPAMQNEVGHKQLTFIQGNFLEQDISDADIIFMNSTCFEDSLMQALEKKFISLKPSVQIISLSKSLTDPAFEVLSSKLMEFSWGEATVYHHKKRTMLKHRIHVLGGAKPAEEGQA